MLLFVDDPRVAEARRAECIRHAEGQRQRKAAHPPVRLRLRMRHGREVVGFALVSVGLRLAVGHGRHPPDAAGVAAIKD